MDSEELFNDHMKKCKTLMREYTCKQHADDGTMCGEYFKNFVPMFLHSKSAHGVYICDLFTNLSEITGYYHRIKDQPSIHVREYAYKTLIKDNNKIFY